jgi:hypothetical protein
VVQGWQGKSIKCYLKNKVKRNKKNKGMAQVAECLRSKYTALSSIPCTIKQKRGAHFVQQSMNPAFIFRERGYLDNIPLAML